MGKQFDVVFPLFLFAFFALSHAKGVLQISKNLHLGFGGTPTSMERNIPFPCLQSLQNHICIQIFSDTNYF